MNHHNHYVSGFFEHHQEADDVFAKLVAQGIPRARVKIYTSASPTIVHKPSADSNEVLKDVLVDGTIGTVVGTGVGALIEVALVAANVTLFVASPLIAPLVLLGWGASIGAVVGAGIGAAENSQTLSALVEDAIRSGQIVLIVETQTDAEKTIAQETIKGSIGGYRDIDAV